MALDGTSRGGGGSGSADERAFLAIARSVGARHLLFNARNAAAVAMAGPIVVLAAVGSLSADDLRDISAGYLSLAGALFGAALAGLAVIVVFLTPAYRSALRTIGELESTLFDPIWVAAVNVIALIAGIGLLAASRVTDSITVLAIATALASVAFFAALVNTLWLVVEARRHGIYGAELEEVAARQAELLERQHQAASNGDKRLVPGWDIALT